MCGSRRVTNGMEVFPDAYACIVSGLEWCDEKRLGEVV